MLNSWFIEFEKKVECKEILLILNPRLVWEIVLHCCFSEKHTKHVVYLRVRLHVGAYLAVITSSR